MGAGTASALCDAHIHNGPSHCGVAEIPNFGCCASRVATIDTSAKACVTNSPFGSSESYPLRIFWKLPIRLPAWLLLLTACLVPASAQSPKAILVDGPGPWQDAQWTFTVTQFTSLLNDAGYTISTVSP